MGTMTYNHNNFTYSVYINGDKKKDAILDGSYWENFKKNVSKYIEGIRIGKVIWNNIEGYFNGDVYSIRIYNKALTAEQVEKNYTATKKYRELNSTNQ